MARNIIAYLAVLLAVFEIGSCLKCYHCNSLSDKRTCGNSFSNDSRLIDCSSQVSVRYARNYLYDILPEGMFSSVVGAPRFCHKIVLQTGTVFRTCLDSNPAVINHTCAMLEVLSNGLLLPDGQKIRSCSVCDKDNCNGAL